MFSRILIENAANFLIDNQAEENLPTCAQNVQVVHIIFDFFGQQPRAYHGSQSPDEVA